TEGPPPGATGAGVLPRRPLPGPVRDRWGRPERGGAGPPRCAAAHLRAAARSAAAAPLLPAASRGKRKGARGCGPLAFCVRLRSRQGAGARGSALLAALGALRPALAGAARLVRVGGDRGLLLDRLAPRGGQVHLGDQEVEHQV